MKLQVTMAKSFFSLDSDLTKFEKIGFKFKVYESNVTEKWMHCTNAFENEYTIEFETIQDLENFIQEYGDIIIQDNALTIYNDHIE